MVTDHPTWAKGVEGWSAAWVHPPPTPLAPRLSNPPAPAAMPDYPNISAANSYLFTRYDSTILDAKPANAPTLLRHVEEGEDGDPPDVGVPTPTPPRDDGGGGIGGGGDDGGAAAPPPPPPQRRSRGSGSTRWRSGTSSTTPRPARPPTWRPSSSTSPPVACPPL